VGGTLSTPLPTWAWPDPKPGAHATRCRSTKCQSPDWEPHTSVKAVTHDVYCV